MSDHAPQDRSHRCLRLVVMGVSGSGKTTVAERLATRFGLRFVDADKAHPAANIAKMSAGIPLTDDDRWPWLRALRDVLADSDAVVITCSALKPTYRDVLREAGTVTFIFLDVDAETVADRMRARRDHFMKADMVASQFAALDPPADDERDVITVDGSLPIETIVDLLAGRIPRA